MKSLSVCPKDHWLLLRKVSLCGWVWVYRFCLLCPACFPRTQPGRILVKAFSDQSGGVIAGATVNSLLDVPRGVRDHLDHGPAPEDSRLPAWCPAL